MTRRRRIYITGGSGSGKTTLAERISGATGIPMFELDAILWQNGGSGEREPADERERRIHEIADRPEWIAEGIYVGWAQELWRESDLVIFMDTSLRLVLWRIFWRHVRAELKRNNRHPGWRKLYRFLRSVSRMYRSQEIGNVNDDEDEILTTAKIRAKLELHRYKALVVAASPDITKILACINHK